MWTDDWTEAQVQFEYKDFVDECLGSNLLSREREEYEARLREFEGDEGAALASCGRDRPPPTGPEVFAQLQEQWRQGNLRTALDVTRQYAILDVLALCLIVSKRAEMILKETGISIYTYYSSISSYAFGMLVRSALTDPSPMAFLPLGERLGRLLRQGIRGGLSFLANRFHTPTSARCPSSSHSHTLIPDIWPLA